MTTARDPRVLSAANAIVHEELPAWWNQYTREYPNSAASEWSLREQAATHCVVAALTAVAHNLALTERIEALERGKDEMTVRTAVAITAQDSFAGAALIAYNVLQEQHDTLAALAKLGVYENDGFRDAVRYEMAREMLKDYLPPTPPGAQP